MSRRVRAQLRPLVAIVGLAALALVVAYGIVREQRLRLPWDDDYFVQAEFSSGQALTPGQGQAVTVAGVKVGEIANVSLRDGRALVRLRLERGRLRAVHQDATMLIRPRTQLQDMTIDVDPGSYSYSYSLDFSLEVFPTDPWASLYADAVDSDHVDPLWQLSIVSYGPISSIGDLVIDFSSDPSLGLNDATVVSDLMSAIGVSGGMASLSQIFAICSAMRKA